MQQVIQTHSCTDDAVAMQIRMQSNAFIYGARFDGGSPNVIGIPYTWSNNNAFDVYVVTELDDADTGEAVTLRYTANVAVVNPITVSITEIAFFKTPWYQGGIADCNTTTGPAFALHIDPFHKLALQMTNPGVLPLTLTTLELVNIDGLLPIPSLDWGDAEFNSLPWQAAVPSGTMLDPAAAPVEVELPNAASEGSAVLCRFISVYDGLEVRGILQAELTEAPVAAKQTTWGAVKALYH